MYPINRSKIWRGSNFVGLSKDFTAESTEKTLENFCGLCDLRGERLSWPILLDTLKI